MNEPEKHFKEVWGTAFTGAKLSHKNGLLELSMEDIYETMQSFADKDKIELIKFMKKYTGISKHTTPEFILRQFIRQQLKNKSNE